MLHIFLQVPEGCHSESKSQRAESLKPEIKKGQKGKMQLFAEAIGFTLSSPNDFFAKMIFLSVFTHFKNILVDFLYKVYFVQIKLYYFIYNYIKLLT